MAKQTKNIKKHRANVDINKIHTVEEAIKLAKTAAHEKFDSTLRVSFNLNLDTKQADQQLRGTLVLPHGTGKVSKVLAIVEEADDIAKAEKAKADFIGGLEMLEKIKNENWFGFDYIVTTPMLMPKFARYGKLLGTKGLMPNPKLGTVTAKVETAIENLKKGSIEYKTDAYGIVNTIIGKKSFSDAHLVANYKEIANLIKSLKPNSVKGDYIKSITISSTMGPGLKLDVK